MKWVFEALFPSEGKGQDDDDDDLGIYNIY